MGINYNPYSLVGKTILVTGASSGIGQATAVECSKMGAQVVITGRNEQRLQETLSILEGEGHQAIALDLSTKDGVHQLVEEVPVVDGLFNNAGITVAKPIGFLSEQELDSIFDINLKAPILLTSLMVKKKKIRKGGSIVFTSSIGKFIEAPGGSLYSSSKGGLSSFMRGAALELAAKQIRCNALLPGMIETSIMEKKQAISVEQWEKNKQLYPMKRFGTPQEVAWAAVYLFSDASSFITGSELIIDGGRSLS